MNTLIKIFLIIFLSTPFILLSKNEPPIKKWLLSSFVEKNSANYQDKISGLYNFKRRYYDPRVNVWISTDPYFSNGKYFPKPEDFDTDHNYLLRCLHDERGKLPGMGGIFNSINLSVYGYVGQNPIKFVDPDGNAPIIPHISPEGNDEERLGGSVVLIPETNIFTWMPPATFNDYTKGNLSFQDVFPSLAMSMAGSPLLKINLLGSPKMADHHIFPAQFKNFFKSKNINIDNFTVSLPQTTSHLKGIHGRGLNNLPGKWNERWSNFINKNPDATQKDIFQFAGKLMDEYGLNNLKVHPYKKNK